MSEKKDTNPKDALGIRKFPITTIPMEIIGQAGLAMMEGGRKYGRHNYRGAKVPAVRASVYVDAAFRHLSAWWEGEDIDPDSGLSHIIKLIACGLVLGDALVTGQLEDDRPPKLPAGWQKRLNEMAGQIIDRYPDAVAPYTAKGEEENS